MGQNNETRINEAVYTRTINPINGRTAMKKLGLSVIFCLVAIAGIAFGQDESSQPLFVLEREVGQLRPTGIQYDPIFDRFVWVDLDGQLVLVDAATYNVQHVLYTSGTYNAYTFSYDGRHLALAIDRRVELWDTQTGTLTETFEPTGALQAIGPLMFSDDDGLLLVNTLVPAPPELRRSENDTSNLPWLWDVADALGEADPSLPRRAESVPFFDFRNGLIMGPNRTLIGGYPTRLVVLDGTSEDFGITAEINSSRAERDPIYVWQSATDDLLYVDPRQSSFYQVDTRDRSAIALQLGLELGFRRAESVAEVMNFSRTTQMIGASNHTQPTSLGRLIYGDGYIDGQNGRTLILIDILESITVAADRSVLLVYNYNERSANGIMELIQLGDLRVLMTPDAQRLIVRRGGGAVEVYHIASGVLERTLYPAEPDYNANYTFELTADGKTLLVDFQRFDILTGALTAHATEYTLGADNIFYAADGSLVTQRAGNALTFRDPATGEAKSEALIITNGEVLATSADSLRYLTSNTNDGSISFEIYNAQTDERRRTTFAVSSSVVTVVPRPDWEQFLIQHASGEVAVYNFDGDKLTSILPDELPSENSRQMGWIDNQTVYIASENPNLPPPREYGFDYHPSGVPACLVEHYPSDWQMFVSVWDGLNLRLSFSQLNELTRRLCASLPDEAAEIISGLTPTPRFNYNAQEGLRTQGGLPGVPLCLTQNFQREQLQYAELWRQLSQGLTDEEKDTLTELLCEGLINSLGQIVATPTVNPNQLGAAAPTALPAAPESVEERELGLGVITIDIPTAQRQFGTYIPQRQTAPPRDLSIIAQLYETEFRRPIGRFALSPDGTRVAMLNDNGFIELYRLTRSYDQLAADEVNAQATRIAEQPRSIGLPATATPGFVGIIGSQPTITPTITPTIPVPPVTDITLQTDENICPARMLYTLDNPPPGYAAEGRIITDSPTDDRTVWVFEPESGRWAAVDGLPDCVNGNCTFSADRAWILRETEQGGLVVSRPDGTDATTLLEGGIEGIPVSNYRFVNRNTVEYEFEAWLPEKYTRPATLFARFDPETGASTEPAERENDDFQIEGLPTRVVSSQPLEGPLRLLNTSYRNPNGGNGARYYLYDTRDDSYEYFVRSDDGQISYQWDARGTTLYYRRPGESALYAYDTATKTHQIIGRYDLPNGTRSNDLRYIAYPLSQNESTYSERLQTGELPLTIGVWDSETLATRRYCVPETGGQPIGTVPIWSPDGRYLLFQMQLPPPGADSFPTPVGEETPPPPTATPVPVELQYELQFPRTLVLDIETGYVTVLSRDIGLVAYWLEDAR